MKVSEIEVGKTYTNGKGRFRKVTKLSINHHYDDYRCLHYYIPNGPGKGESWEMTRRRFADWAKAEVTELANALKDLEAPDESI